MQSLLLQFINGEDVLNTIHAIALWGSDDEKKSYLFVNNVLELHEFIDKSGGDINIMTKSRDMKNNNTSLCFSKKYPYGTPYFAKFYYSKKLCTILLS